MWISPFVKDSTKLQVEVFGICNFVGFILLEHQHILHGSFYNNQWLTEVFITKTHSSTKWKLREPSVA